MKSLIVRVYDYHELRPGTRTSKEKQYLAIKKRAGIETPQVCTYNFVVPLTGKEAITFWELGSVHTDMNIYVGARYEAIEKVSRNMPYADFLKEVNKRLLKNGGTR